MPEKYPEGFLFDGPKIVEFKMVDWFSPIPWDDIHFEKIKPWVEYVELLEKFIKGKLYYNHHKNYLLITTFNEAIIITPEHNTGA